MLPRVAIVYLAYNTHKYLPEIFESLERLNYPKDKLEIIAVDNASKDESAAWLHQKEGITFFPNTENLGFAQGNNLGMKHAILDGIDYVYLLNGDAKLHPDAIMEAVKLAENDPKIGAVQSRVMLWKLPEIVNVTGGMVHFLGFGFARDNGLAWNTIQHKYKDGDEIAYPSGAAVLYRAHTLKEVGLLDPFLFLYHEDLELGWRIRLASYKNVLSIHSIAYHDYEFRRSIQKFYWMERNRILVHFSHLKSKTIFLLLPFLFLSEIGLIAFAIKGGWLKEKLLVYVNLLSPKTWKYIVRKRAESRFLRRNVTDKEIVRLWASRIEHQETQSTVVDSFINPTLSVLWWLIRKLV